MRGRREQQPALSSFKCYITAVESPEQMVLEQLDMHEQKKKNLDTDHILFTNITSKWSIDLHVQCKTMKLLEDNIGEKTGWPGARWWLLDTTPKGWLMREIIEKLGFIKIKNFFSVKDNGQRMRRQATDWGKIFAKHISN